MNRPDNISVYDELDLKLGIKSSLPHVKSTIALAILLWECADRPSELIYSVQNNDGIVMTDNMWHSCSSHSGSLLILNPIHASNTLT